MKIHLELKDISSKFHDVLRACFKKLFLGICKEVVFIDDSLFHKGYKVFLGNFKSISGIFQEYFKSV